MGAAPAVFAAQEERTAFSIPAQPLDEALIAFARATGAQVLYAPEIARGLQSSPVSGILSPEQALEQLLAGTSVSVASHSGGVFTLRPEAPSRTRREEALPPHAPESLEGREPIETITVVGERRLLQRSLQRKREAEYLMDIVTTDDIASLPDGNPAEALRRVPGVFALEDQGEGRYAGIRGIDPELMNITFNGQPLGAPEGGGSGGGSGRAVRMDSIPADLIGSIEVVKAVTPDMDHNAIGGGINITTASPFQREGTYARGSLETGYNDASGNALWAGSATYGTKFGADERWGLLVTGSYSQRTIGSQRMSSDSWQETNGFFVPSTQNLFDYLVDRRRWGVNASLGHQPSDAHSIRLNASYNRHRDDEDRQLTEYNFARGTLSDQTETSGAFTGGRITREYRWYLQEDTIATVSMEGDHALSAASSLDWAVGYSLAEKSTPRRVDWEFRTGGNAFPNTYDTSMPLYRITPDDLTAYLDPDSYPFRRLRRRTDEEREDIYSARLNFQRDLSLGGRQGYWRAGASYLRRDKMQDRQNDNYLPAQPFTLGDFDFAGPDIPGFFGGRYIYGPTLNIANLERFFTDRSEFFAFDDEASILNSTGGDYEGGEEISAAYGMLSMAVGDLNVLAGVRVEHTQAEYAANETFFENGDFSGQIRTVRGRESYTDIFPGAHLRWTPARTFVARASWTNTIGRQPFMDLAPIRSFSVFQDETTGALIGSVSEGNPNLEPFRSTNYDLSLEYYPTGGGTVSVAFFHKDIENAVFRRSLEQTDVEFEGFRFEQLTFSRPENADAGSITGVEFNAQRFFDFLPEPLDGFGASLNYTFAESSLEVFSRPGETLPYIRQPRHIGNAALIYEKYGLSARVAVSYTGEFLRGVGADREVDPFRARRVPVDARVSYDLTPRVSVFVNARNINDVPDSNFSGRSNRRTAQEIYSWTGWAGVKWSL
jgi:TonB-dependent receptor